MPSTPRLIVLAARLVPPSAREAWAREWTAEVLHRRSALERRGALGWAARVDLALRVLGAVPDALAVRRITAGRDGGDAADVFAGEPLRTAGAVAVLALAAAVETVGFAAVTAARGPVPWMAAVAALAVGMGVLLAAANAAAGVLTGVPPIPLRAWPRPSVGRRHRGAAAVALLGAAEGLALALAASRWPPTDGAERVLAGGLGPSALAFHVGVAAALALLLTLRLRRAPDG
jgi:hypothetical protein